MTLPAFSPTCPICGALLGPAAHGGPERHAEWHFATGTLRGWSTDELLERVKEQRRLAELVSDDAPTAKLPPITETTRRRPPVPPAVRELRGRELLDELGRLLDAGVFDDDDEQCRRLVGADRCQRAAGHPGECNPVPWRHES